MTEYAKTLDEMTCRIPQASSKTVLLGHGSGGKLSSDLLHDVFLPAFHNPVLARLDDQATVQVNGCHLAFTTDSFVVKPLFFPGGDIASLAVHGTVNDLAMGGAKPLFLSVAFIIEEGFPLETLRRLAASLRRAAESACVSVVTGDTKVVEKGCADGLFINTSGIGIVRPRAELSSNRARPGDRILLNGPIAEHGIAILAQREGIEFETSIESDSAPLHTLVATMLDTDAVFRCFRDPTRGGVSSALNEIAAQSRVGIVLDESAIPIREEVRGACELLGLDPLYVANEGKLISIVEAASTDRVLDAMRRHPLGRQSQIIGTVTDANPGILAMKTVLGTKRIVDMLPGDQLPRIC